MALLIDGKKIAQDMVGEIKAESEKLGIKPGLVVILVGEDPASAVYVRNKEKDCEKAGFYHKTYRLAASTTQDELLLVIKDIEKDCNVHGLIVQLPLPKHINEEIIINAIPENKDADCFNPSNVGRLMTKKKGDSPLLIAPCTPAGIVELLDRYNISIAGKNVAIVGRSNIVGKPMALMMLNRDATVTICHSKTKNLGEVLKQADIVITAVGVAKLIKKEMLKDNCVVIDVGMNRLKTGELVGDVDFEDVKCKVYAITPVPGGVGPMTRAMLLKNTLMMAKRQKGCE
ncbi:MAG: bifunctional 5,10-methylenetetrahydrofolate dehydrogenase/5,10-methenyltetrahydrofolate cyclohydrolase [Proteobacteria bacterium]|nr:bifunctional 5,10-methylenetetrahydrofolate dehydrogenase/5,10-methenyltetrahydrofolate cyclohydrolase [Pseudomonadota bacterium]